MEVGSYRRGSDDTSEQFDDFAALPEQFRPKKTFIRTEPKNPTVIPKTSTRKENGSNLKNVSREGSLGRPSDSSPISVSKSVIEKNGKNTLSSSSNTLPQQNKLKTPLQDRGTPSERYVPKKDAEKNPSRKGPSLSKKFSEMSVETAPKDTTKVKKRTVWNNDLVIQTEPQVWKFNGATLEPEKTDYRVTKKRTEVKKETSIREGSASRGSKNSRSAWNDDLVVEKRVNFGYISKETRNGSSTITACWGDVHQTRPLGPPKQRPPKQKHVDKPPRKTFPDAKHGETEHQNPPIADKPIRRRSNKNVKTTVIRHEIKVIHVNEKGEPLSQKEASSRLPLEDLVPGRCKGRLFAFGTKAGLEDSQLFHCAVPSKSKESSHSPSETPDDTPSKRSGEDFDRETPEALVDDSSKDQKRSSFLRYGREISDVVAGSHLARSLLVALFEKWIPVRNRTIELMETLAENVSSSRSRNSRVQRAVDLIQSGSQMAIAVPNIKVSVVARIIAAIAPFVSMLFKSSPKITQTGVTETQTMNQIQDDIEATLEVYMFGTQCDHQFREACELFERFRGFVDDNGDVVGDVAGAEFASDVAFFSPKNPVVYYRRLHKAFLRLRDSHRASGDVGRTFCRGFEDHPGAMETVRLLPWRFPAQIEDSEAFQRAWKEVSRVLDDASDTEVLEDVRDCINILRKERRTIENNMAELRENIE